jgi:alkylation response protein AidB-like acyl-CoA dehydrogenase
MNLELSPAQQELVALARTLAREHFAPRAERHDREASFPFDDYDDLRTSGLLAACVPTRYGGRGASYETYCLVAEQLAQGNGSTSLTFNMHCLTMMMMGEIADDAGGAPAPRAAARTEVRRGPRAGRVLRSAAQRADRAGPDRHRAVDGRPALRHHGAQG